MDNATDRLTRQITFLLEIDKLKSVLRRSYLVNGTRRENSAEHSWHLAVMAMILAEHANRPVDPLRVLKMLLVHDIVEIDADDTYCYDEVGGSGQGGTGAAGGGSHFRPAAPTTRDRRSRPVERI